MKREPLRSLEDIKCDHCDVVIIRAGDVLPGNGGAETYAATHIKTESSKISTFLPPVEVSRKEHFTDLRPHVRQAIEARYFDWIPVGFHPIAKRFVRLRHPRDGLKKEVLDRGGVA